MGRGYDVLGPSVHHYLDHDRSLPADGQVSSDRALLADLRRAVPEEEWAEGGFAGEPETVFVALADGRPAAAANLTEFGPWLADVGVLTHPDHRGQGLGRVVAAAATASSLAANGLARWRAREENLPSLALATRLGYEPWCRQLAVKPR
jgi:RimJ/RimL family protein N-acetyltransferase